MAFKQVDEYRKDKYGKMLVLPNDQDSVDIILMYRSQSDVLLADVHYIKSDDYSGYVHCLGRGCPACSHVTPNGGTGIRIQPKLFIPVYNIAEDEIMFFDRSVKFEAQLQDQVFSKYPNPSDYVFRLTRNGVAGSMDTKYFFMAVGNNSVKSFEQICKDHEVEFPSYYEGACRDVDAITMKKWLANSGGVPDVGPMMDYTVTPRGGNSMAGNDSQLPSPDFSEDSSDANSDGEPEF